MTRNERSTLTGLRKSVNGKEVCVEIPITWSHDGRQAAHELLISKGLVAKRIGWNNITDEWCIQYQPAVPEEEWSFILWRQGREDADEMMHHLAWSNYSWNGYKRH